MRDKEELVIDRKIWLNGSVDGPSMLYRKSDGRMCCLGIYLKKNGVSVANLRDKLSPISCRNVIPENCQWLLGDERHNGEESHALMIANDNSNISEEEREEWITKHFERANVDVTFIN